MARRVGRDGRRLDRSDVDIACQLENSGIHWLGLLIPPPTGLLPSLGASVHFRTVAASVMCGIPSLAITTRSAES